MSNNENAFERLLRKRAKKGSHRGDRHTQTAKSPVSVTPQAPKKPRNTVPPKRRGFDPSSQLDFGTAKPGLSNAPAVRSPAPSRSALQVEPRKGGKRVRHLIHVDMVDAENRLAIETAAESEGRSVSQWCRLVLLRAARNG